MSQRNPAPNVGRFTGIVLGLVVFICVVMIGGTGYLKYQLDRSEILLAAPDSAVGSDQDLFDRLRRDLGYGGFLGLAQNYALNHDASGFAEMKAEIKAADDIVTHLPDKTPAETRHELTAIVGTFDDALKKISAPANETNSAFSPEDLTPLYASLPILDARVSSANEATRLAAQSKLQFWAMLLTLVSWCSLIIAAACAAGIYLTLRDKHSAPMRALAQSIQNMARGDMRTAIWGTERQDMIGELARAVDTARYHFSHLPDLSLLSDQGPVRLRFEGGSRSLFEAMMKTISRDSENIREQTANLTQTVQSQKETLTQMSGKVESALHNILQTGTNGDVQIRQAIHEMVGSAESLKNAHAHAADQLNRLIPTLQDRAQGMAEIANITGKQIGQTLQSLASSEAGMKANAEQAKETLNRLFTTADDLGERLFGAINLLQASGKVLAETTQSMQGSFAVSNENGESVRVTAALDDAALEPLAQRLEQITEQLAAMESKMDTQPVEMAPVYVDDSGKFETLLAGFTQLLADRIEPKLAMLEQNIGKRDTGTAIPAPAFLAELGEKITALATGLPATLRTHMEADWQRMVARIEAMQDKIEQQKTALLTHADAASAQTRDVVMGLSDKISSLSSANPTELRHGLQDDLQNLAARIEQQIHVATERTDMASTTVRQTMLDLSDKISSFGQNLPQDLHRQMQQDWQSLSSRLESANAERGSASGQLEPKLAVIEQQVRTINERMETSAASVRQMMLEMSERLTLIGQKLPHDLQHQLQQDWQRVVTQIESAYAKLGPAVIGSIDPKLTALGQMLTQQSQSLIEQGISTIADQAQGNISSLYDKLAGVQNSVEKLVMPDTFGLPPQVLKQLDNHWYQMAAQIEASRASIDKTISEQVSSKLAGFAQALEMTRQAVETIKAGTRPQANGLSPDLQRQMDEHWYQMTAQIESSRASLVESIADQIAKMESRLAGKTPDALSKSASEYTTQRQIEQQTQILTELVSTLGILDSHMQQIKTEMHATGR